ncbi:MAG: helix-turn-helix domain-containing protein [Cyclobacteriaceae bacterium]
MDLQKRFLDELKKVSGRPGSFADEIAQLLGLSTDSIYRRMRGDTVLSLEEVQKLCIHFHFSIDALLSPSPERVNFRQRIISHEGYTLFDWIKTLRRNLAMMCDAAEKNILCSGKDIPLLYYFHSPELASFKMYFWMKSMFYYPAYQTGKYKHSAVPEEYLQVVSDIWEYYSRIDSTEIWTEDCVDVTLNQIEFYHRCGFFEDREEGLHLCEVFRSLLTRVKHWALNGLKDDRSGKLRLYKNEILLADNTVLFKVNNQRIVFIPHNMIAVISTTHQSYCEQTEKDIRSYVDRSAVLSTTGEKERNIFFNALDARINSAKERIAEVISA